MNTPQTPYGEPLIELSPEWQRARMLGRREALDILIEQNAEDFPDDFQQSRSLGDTGDFMTEWKVKKLEELFDAKEPSSLIEHLYSSHYEIAFELCQVTAERDAARAEIEAMRNELNALRWIPITERLPTIEDGDEFEDVEWSDGIGIWQGNYDIRLDTNDEATHWRRITLP